MDTTALVSLTFSAQDMEFVKQRKVVWEECARIGRIPLTVMVREAEMAEMQLQEHAMARKVGAGR